MQRPSNSYLLRIWKENPDEDCRASLQDVTTCERHYFSNLPALADFLRSAVDPLSCRLPGAETQPNGE